MEHWAEQRRQAALEHLTESGWLKHVQWLEEIDSTNSLSRRLLQEHLELPALLVADRQTAGRGRSARVWWSPGGCLMFSLVISTQHIPADPLTWTQLSLVSGVAAAIAVEREVPNVNVRLKWPNDLYLHDRKLAGILVEAVALNNASSDISSRMAFIIGIGLNATVDFAAAPREIQDKACSLSQFSSVALTMEGLLVRIVEQLELELAAWQVGQDNWWRQWSERSLLTNRAVQLQLSSGRQILGQCTGIDSVGYLMVRDAQQTHLVQSAEILKWS